MVLLILLSGCQQNRTARIFTDITQSSNLNFTHNAGPSGNYPIPESMGSGGALLDYDNDGDLDIYLCNGRTLGKSSSPVSTNKLFRQDPGMVFTDVTEASGTGNNDFSTGVAVGDVDNDGYVDIYVSNYGQDKLYRNNGDGTFKDITERNGIYNPVWGASAIMMDFNRDGHLDIFVTTYGRDNPAEVCRDMAGVPDYCGPSSLELTPDVLFMNNGDGSFRDASRSSGISSLASNGLGVVSHDFTGDGRPDIYVANDGKPNYLWIQDSSGRFTNQASARGVAVNETGAAEAGMGIALGDADNDGDLDMLITHLYNETNTYYRNDGKVGFVDHSLSSGLGKGTLPYTGFGTGFLDFNNDGLLDLALVNGRVNRGAVNPGLQADSFWNNYAEPNFFYTNMGPDKFIDVSSKAREFGNPVENSRGLLLGDINNDGSTDMLVINSGQQLRLYRNDRKDQGNWITVVPVLPDLNRIDYGALVKITCDTLTLTRYSHPGYGYLTSNDPRVHVGFGQCQKPDSLQVTWYDGTRESFDLPQMKTITRILKGKGKIL